MKFLSQTTEHDVGNLYFILRIKLMKLVDKDIQLAKPDCWKIAITLLATRFPHGITNNNPMQLPQANTPFSILLLWRYIGWLSNLKFLAMKEEE